MYGTLPLLLTPFNHTIKLHQIPSIVIWASSCSLDYCYCLASKAILHIAANASCANL